jgi:hypothetical protein
MAAKNPVTIAAVIVGIVVVGWFVYSLQESEEDRIHQRLHDLAEYVSTTKQTRESARLMHIAGLQQFFTGDVTVQIKEDIPKVTGRDNLLQMAHIALQYEPGLTVAFTDISVTHDDGTPHARVNTTVVVTGVRSQKARSVDAQELEMALVKAEGEWFIEAVRSVKVIELQ